MPIKFVHGGTLEVQGAKPRIGLVVPPVNTAAEDYYHTFGCDQFSFSSTRYGYYKDLPLRKRLDCYATELPTRLDSFGHMAMHAIISCCSGNHYLQGFDGDLGGCLELSDSVGVATLSTTVAVVAWLRHLGVDKVTMVTPYEDWLNELSLAYWSSAGLKVDTMIQVVEQSTGETAGSPYHLGTDDILAAVRGHLVSYDPVLMVGTGMDTREALSILSQEYPEHHFHTSNSCVLSWLRLTLNDEDPLTRLR